MSKNKKPISLDELKIVASDAISYFNANKYIDWFSDVELKTLCLKSDPRIFNDSAIINNATIRDNVKWNSMKPKRICRLMARLLDTGNEQRMNSISTKELKLQVGDIKPLLIREPSIIERFSIDMKKLTDIESYFLLSLGKDYFLDHIDVRKKGFSITQQYNICKSYSYRRRALMLFNCKLFDGFQTKEILLKTNEENLDILDIRNMKVLDWIDLVTTLPNMFLHCETELLADSHIYQLIRLAELTNSDKLYSIIKSKDPFGISPLGWEKLLINRFDMFKDTCEFDKLDSLNKKNIIAVRPDLSDLLAS